MYIKFLNQCWRHLSGIVVCLTEEEEYHGSVAGKKKYIFILEEKHKGSQCIKLGSWSEMYQS